MIEATACVSASARTVSVPVSRTEAATGAGAHSSAPAGAVRIQPYVGRVLHSYIRQHRIVGKYDVFLDVDGRVHGELWIIHGLNLGRDNRVFFDLGQLALDGVDNAVVPGAATAACRSVGLGRRKLSYIDVCGDKVLFLHRLNDLLAYEEEKNHHQRD